jgi:uncharacterized repeat protein (TIGR01451 family)
MGEKTMRSKANILTTLSVVHLVAAALLSLTITLGQPVMVAGSALGLTPTTETVPTPQDTPVPPPPPPPTPSGARLELTKTASPSEVLPGGSVTFVIRVCNVGDATADNVVVSDALSSDLELVSASVSQGRAVVVGNGVRAEFGALFPGECAELRIVARVRADVLPGTQIGNVGTMPDQASNQVTVTVMGLLPESGGAALTVVAGLLVVGLGLLAASTALRAQNRAL